MHRNYSVFATDYIPKGTIVWVLNLLGQILHPSVLQKVDPHRKAMIYKYAIWKNVTNSIKSIFSIELLSAFNREKNEFEARRKLCFNSS